MGMELTEMTIIYIPLSAFPLVLAETAILFRSLVCEGIINATKMIANTISNAATPIQTRYN